MGDPLRLQDFQFLARIGKGQFGKVDAVRFTRDGGTYALKTIDKSKITRVGEALNVDLEKHVLVQGSIVQSSSGSEWSPVPKLLTTISSPSALHIVFSFANCGTLWDLFCSTDTTPTHTSKASFDEQWLQKDEGGNGTLFSYSSHSADSNSLFKSAAGTPIASGSRRLSEDTLVFYIKQLVLALQWLHEEVKVVHRDIKPENILLMENGRAVICDFGSAARLMYEDGDDVRQQSPPHSKLWPRPKYLSLSDCQTLHGTADYIAPEVLQTYEQVLLDSDASIFRDQSDDKSIRVGEKRGYDASVDWWSFGAMCYELITGLPPFYAPTIEETYGMIVSCEMTLQRPERSSCSLTFSDFLVDLLVPSRDRLGKLGPEQVKQHQLLRSTDWDKVRNNDKSILPTTFQNPRPLEVPDEPRSNHNSLAQSYGSGLLGNPSWLQQLPDGTPGSFSNVCEGIGSGFGLSNSFFHVESAKRSHDYEMEDERWAHWEWVSPSVASFDRQDNDRPGGNSPVLSAVKKTGLKLPVFDRLKQEATPDRDYLRRAAKHHQTPGASTPAFRPGNGNQFVTPGIKDAVAVPGTRNPKVPLSVPRSMPRTLTRGSGHGMVIMSESKALRLMARCVQQSARKKNLASARKQNGLAESRGRVNRGVAHVESQEACDQGSVEDPAKSFMSRLKSVRQSSQHELKSVSDNSGSVVTNKPKDAEPQASRASTSFRNPYGFDAFVAELGKIGEGAYNQSSPCFARARSFASYSSHSSTESSIRDETDDRDARPRSPPLPEPVGQESTAGRSVRMEEQEKPFLYARGIVPKSMNKDDLLSRLFPGFARDTSKPAHSSTFDRGDVSVSPRMTKAVSLDDSYEAKRQDGREPRQSAKPGNPIATKHNTSLDGPTVRIEGLKGKHQRMEENLAHLERMTREVKEKIEGLKC